MENTAFLEHIGLTKGEVRVYLALLQLGQTTTGPIIKESGISSSKVYEILDKLLEKGLISYVEKNKTKHFQATSPKKFENYLEEQSNQLTQKKDQLNKHLPGLMALYKEKQILQNAQIFVGEKALREMLWDNLEDAKKGEEYYFFGGAGEEYEQAVNKFYNKYAKERHRKGLITKGLAEKKHKQVLKNNPHVIMRYTDFPTPSNIGIFRDTLAIASWSQPPIGILITSKNLVDQFKLFFNSVWAVAKN